MTGKLSRYVLKNDVSQSLDNVTWF